MTVAFLFGAVGMLAFRARRRRGYAPFVLGIVAAWVIMLGKFSFASNAVLYAGLGLLISASIWNSWPVNPNCECTPAAMEFQP
jgi:mercuric ion transport protein